MAGPFTDEQRRILDEIEHDERTAAWLNARRAPAKTAFWKSDETRRALLTAVMIPIVAWAASGAYETVFHKAQAQEAEQREEVQEIAQLVPIGLQSDEGRRIVIETLGTRAKGDGSIVGKALIALTRVTGNAAPAAPNLAPTDKDKSAASPAPAPDAATGRQLLANRDAAPTIVYPQIYDEADRRDAKALSDALIARYVPVAGIENVLHTHPDLDLRFAQRGSIGVRYYHPQDRKAADYVAAQIAATLPARLVTVMDLSGRASAAAVKAGLVEVWFPIPPH